MDKPIKINCTATEMAPIERLKRAQGGLKTLTSENYEKLKRHILKHGILQPITVWQENDIFWILDGHQRLNTIEAMLEEGYELTHVPISKVDAPTKAEAMRQLLGLASSYGEVTPDGLYEFIHRTEIDLPEINDFNFAEFKMADFKNEFFNEISLEDPDGADGGEAKAEPKKKPKQIQCPSCGNVF